MHKRHDVADTRRGAATVELAILTPFLLAIILGLCELGQSLKVEALLSQAARKACAVGTRPGASNSDVIYDARQLLSSNGLPAADATITILVNGVASNVATATRGDKVSVSVSIPNAKINSTKTNMFTGADTIQSEVAIMIKQG